MDNRLHPLRTSQRLLTYLVCGLVAWQPLLPAMSAAITPVTGGTQMDQAANGVPVMNIATPNGAGISHNQFKDYNVGKEGLILNNATGQLNQTQLGGYIQANPNLTAGREAQGIINEVTGGSRSQLQGFTEVAGKAANVIVANPWGITCNGCGFINTPNATLTTGKPQFDDKGNLSALNVTGGTITVEGKGLDASQSDALSIISRATEVNAAIHAKDLNVTVGAVNGEGPAPTVAVDTGALGGMYANRIHLVSSEKGVGVNLGNLTARQGDISLDANGKLVLNNSLSGGALTVKATDADLRGDNKATGAATVTAQNGIALKQGSLVSDKSVSLTAGDGVDIADGKVTAGEAIRLAGSGLTIDKTSTADAAGNIDLNAQDGALDNAGQLTAGQAMTLNAGTVSNTGSLAAKGRLDATGKTLDNKGTLSAGGDVGLHVDDRIRNDGSILADGTLEATTGELVQDGKLSGRKGVTAKSDTLSSGKDAQTLSEGDITVNTRRTADIAGEVNAGGSLALNSGTLNTDTTARLQGQSLDLTATKATLNGTQAAKQALSVKADTLAHGGKSSAEKVTLKASDSLTNGGTVTATDLALESGNLTNSGLFQGTGSLSLNTGVLNNLSGAALLSDGQLTLTADSWGNDGVALSAGDATVRVKDTLTNSGKILGQQGVDLTAATTDNAGQVMAKVLALHGDLVNSGLLQGDDSLALTGQTLTNSADGQMLSAGNTTLDAGTLDNRGELQANTLDVTAGDWTNGGTTRATDSLTAALSGTLNNSGTLRSTQALDLNAAEIANSGILAADRLSLSAPQLSNSGILQGKSALTLSTDTLSNHRSGELLSGNGLALTLDSLQNDGLLHVGGTFDLKARELANSGSLQADRLALDIGDSLVNNAGAELLATQDATLKAKQLDNAGTLAANSLSVSSDTLTNRGTLQGDSALTADFGDLANQTDGKVVSGGKITVTGGDVRNDGQWQGQALELNADSLMNRGDINGIAGVAGTLIGTLDNSGTLRSQGTAHLHADSLQNSGRLMADDLTLEANSLQNQGLLQGNNALSARGNNTLEQSADGRMLTNGTLALTGGQLTTDGKLQGQQVTLDADDWQHSGSLVGGSSLLATVANQMVNDGELMNLGDMQLNAGALDNRGSVLSSGDITLGGNSLKNSGSVQGLTLALTQGQITNAGKLIGIDALTVAAPVTTGRMMRTLMAQPERELRNEQGGSMLTQGDLILHSDNVINNGSWQGKNILLNAQRLNNGGDIQSAGDMQLVLGDSLTSGAGSKIVANGTAALEALTLTNQGEWVAGNLALKASTLTNGGTVSGVNGLTLDLREGLTQQQGSTLETGGALALTIADLDNQGRIQAGTLAITGNNLTNNGTLQGDKGLTLTMRDSLTNTASGTLLSGNGVTLAAPALTNDGLIQGGDASTLTATGSVRNAGKILNDGALTVTAPELANTGMLQATDLILNAANLGNSGTLLGSDSLNVTAQQVNQQAAGKLLSGGNLILSSNGFDQLGQVVALGDATLKLINSFDGRGTLAAGKTLAISSNGDLTNNGVMQGDALTLSADGALVNNGTLTSGNGASTLTGNRIENGKTGSLQGGGNIDLVSRGDITLNGFTGSGGTLTLSAPGTIVNTALLYAANNLWLLADSIKNQGGNILAGDSLWMQRDKAGAANSEILNTSGTIETTTGDITLKTGHLLNQWESITQGESKTENLATGYQSYSPGTVELPLSIFTPEEIHYRSLLLNSSITGPGGASEALPRNLDMVKEVAISRITSTTKVTGSAGRIAAGGNLSGVATSLDNLGSDILAGKSLSLSGDRLNNQSWLSGTQTVWRKYTVSPKYKTGRNEDLESQFDVSYGAYSDTGSPVNRTLTFITTDEYRTEGGSSLRGVIQANGDVSTRFGTIVNNSESTEVRGTIAPTLTRPGLQTLVQRTLSGETGGADPTEFQPIAVNSPAWRDQLQNALQQVNGGGTLDTQDGQAVSLGNHPQGSINYTADGTATSLNANPWQQNQQGKPFDTNAYPLPQGDNGYFTVSDAPDSPYLIAINPKLNGLGTLDKNVYGDLYQLLNMQPDAVPVETRQQYTDKGAFLGSAYFLDRLNLKPEYDYRILGDAAFDTRYVSNTVLSQTGNRYINGMGSDLDQMKYLMDNAAAAQQSLGLKAGVTLTADQIASLDRSILWWEAATINGQTVLVPKLYLAAGDVTINNGSVIAGNNVTIDGDSVSNNGGTLLAKQGMTIDSQTGIDNRNASLIKAGEGLQLSAVSDINNIGSTISGKQVALESLNGDINNLTLTTQTRNDSGWNRSLITEQDEKAAINALDSLSLSAGKNISVAGAALSAGGDTALKAGNNIDILANNNAMLFDTAWRHYKSTSSAANTLESGGKLDITAGNNLTIQASNIDGAKDAVLMAGNDLLLNAGQTAKNIYSSFDRSYSSQADRSSISAEGNLTLTAGRDLTSHAASLDAGEKVGIQSGRDVNLLAEATTWGDSYRGGIYTAVNDHVRQQGTEITSGGDTVIVAGRDVNSKATQVLAEKDIGIAAQNDINLLTATESDYRFEDKTKSKSGFLSKKSTRTVEEHSSTNELATLLSGDNVSLQAGNDLLIRGSAVAADGDIALKGGGDVTIDAATERASDYSMKKTTKSGFFSNGIGFTIGSQSAQETRKGAQVTQSDSRSVIGTTAGNIIIEAGDKATLVAANMVAGRDAEDTTRKTGHIDVKANDIDIVAGKDVVTGSVEQKTKSSGFGISISNPIVDTIRNIRDIAKTSGGSNITQAKTIAGEGAASAFDILDGAMKIALPFTYGQSSSKSEMHYAGEYAVGSTLSSGGNVQLTATGNKGNGDVLINGSNIGAKEAAIIDAQGNVDITASTDKQVTSSESSSKNWSITTAAPSIGSAIRTVSGGPNNGSSILPFGYGKSNSKEYNETTAQTGSQITAEDVYINSKDGHVNVSGSSLAAINDLMLTAKNGEITVDTGNNHVVKETSGSQTQIGTLGGDGYSGTVGWSRDKYASQLDQNQQSTLRSQIASRDGDVTLAAGKDVAIDGADISAGKSVNISGENVRLDVSEDTLKSHSESSNTQYGVKASASGWVVSAAQAVENAARSVEENRDPRLSAIYAAQAGLNIASQTMQSDMNPSAVKVTVSATAGSSKQEQDYNSQQQQGTSIKAGESVNISADKDITGAGVNIAGKNVNLDAGRDIILATAQDKEALKNTASGNQFSVGVGFNLVGQQNGFSIELGASTYSNKENGDGLVHHNSQIVADETLTVNSGRDTTLKGTELKGDKVAVDVGRNLTIASLQDEQNYESKNKSGGVNVSICVPPICAGSSVSGSVNAAGGKITNEYKSVIDQSGIFAGQGGFDVHVGEHTQLDGAVIASDATADKNRLDTGTLGWTDIENKAKSGGSQYAVSVSGGVGQNEDGSLKPIANGLPTASLASVSDSDSSSTRSAVAEGEIVIRDKDKQKQDIADLSRDTANAHQALENNFDKDKIRDQLEIQTQAVALGTQAMDAWRTNKLSEEKAKIRAEMEANGDLKGLTDEQINTKIEHSEQYKNVDKEYGVGSEFWRNGTALTGLLAGVLGGNVSGGMAAGAAPYVAALIKDVTKGFEPARIALHTLASAVLVKAQGGNSAAGAAGGFIAASSSKALSQAFYGKNPEELSPEEKTVISNLVTALGAAAGSAAGGGSQGIGSGANAAKVEVENNTFNLAGRTDEQVRAGIQRQVDGVDLDQVYGDDQEKKDAYRKGREEGVKEGFKDGVVEVVESTADSILHPIDSVADLLSAVWNYDETYSAIKLSLTQWNELYEYALVNDPELAGKMAGALQGKIIGNIGANIVVSGAAAKLIQKAAQMESGVKWLPDAHGKNHATLVKGDVHIPVDKIEIWLRGGAAGDVEALTSRLNKLKDERNFSQKDFAKSGKAEEIKKIEDNLERIDRSRQMGRDLERVGIDNISNLNNSIIIDKLMNSTKEVTAANRKSSIVMTGPNGSVRITATWFVQADGIKRLSTVTTGVFNLK